MNRFHEIEPVKVASMLVRVGAGVVLRELDAHVTSHGLSLGPVTPGAMGLTVGEFLEGPYAGLHPIPGGRLEPLCASMRVALPDGRTFETNDAPRSAAGPDLAGLVLGGHGKLAQVTHATVRCVPYPERDVRVAAFEFENGDAFVAAMQRALAGGFWPWRCHLEVRERVHAEVRWAATVGGVERDRELLQRVTGQSAAPHPGPLPAGEGVGAEVETTWPAVAAALNAGKALQLFRLSLGTVVARGDIEGLPLQTRSAWHPVSARLSSLFRGAP